MPEFIPTTEGDIRRRNLIEEMSAFMRRWRSGDDLMNAFRIYFGDEAAEKREMPQEELGAFTEWVLFAYRSEPGAQTILEDFLARRRPRLVAEEIAQLEAWRDSRMALFEVLRIESGVGVELIDVYNGGTLFVHDVTSSRDLVKADCVFSRVEQSAERNEFTSGGTRVPRHLLSRVREFIEREAGLAGVPPGKFIAANVPLVKQGIYACAQDMIDAIRLVNKDGDPIEISIALYEHSDAAAVSAALGAIAGFEPEPTGFAWLDGDRGDTSRSSLGQVTVEARRLQLQCDSRARLARGRALIEEHAGKLLHHISDQTQELPRPNVRELAKAKPEKPAVSPEIEHEIIAQYKAQHYGTWASHPLPALRGKTPLEAVKTARGRAAVIELLKDLENTEEHERREGRAAFDFAPIRAQLGLPPA